MTKEIYEDEPLDEGLYDDEIPMLTPEYMETMGIVVPVERLGKDLSNLIRAGDIPIDRKDLRYIIDSHYQVQKLRCGIANQVRSQDLEPHDLLAWFFKQMVVVETQMKRVIDGWVKLRCKTASPTRWARNIIGVGPLIAASLEAYVDITQTPTPSALWRFSGLDPTCVWKKGAKRPYCAQMKQVAFKLGDSFVKNSGRRNCYYGLRYREQKAIIERKNDEGAYRVHCETALKKRKELNLSAAVIKNYEAYRLPPFVIEWRARRKAVKLFLSHWWVVAYESHYGKTAPEPWIIRHGGHVDYIRPEVVTEFETQKGKERTDENRKSKDSKPKGRLHSVSPAKL